MAPSISTPQVRKYLREFHTLMESNYDFATNEHKRVENVKHFCATKLRHSTSYKDQELISLADYVTKKMLLETPEVRKGFIEFSFPVKNLSEISATGVANYAALCHAHPDQKQAAEEWKAVIKLHVACGQPPPTGRQLQQSIPFSDDKVGRMKLND